MWCLKRFSKKIKRKETPRVWPRGNLRFLPSLNLIGGGKMKAKKNTG